MTDKPMTAEERAQQTVFEIGIALSNSAPRGVSKHYITIAIRQAEQAARREGMEEIALMFEGVNRNRLGTEAASGMLPMRIRNRMKEQGDA